MENGVRLLSSILLCGILTACTPDPESNLANEPPPLMQRLRMEEWSFVLGDYPPKILVVDYWATWCGPCIERFPRMVEMSEQYAEQGVAFVSFNLDEPEDPFAESQAEDFLLEMEANFDHYATADNVFDTMEFLGLQSIPAVSIYDRSGVEAIRLTGEDPSDVFDDTDVEQAILEILEEQELPY